MPQSVDSTAAAAAIMGDQQQKVSLRQNEATFVVLRLKPGN